MLPSLEKHSEGGRGRKSGENPCSGTGGIGLKSSVSCDGTMLWGLVCVATCRLGIITR